MPLLYPIKGSKFYVILNFVVVLGVDPGLERIGYAFFKNIKPEPNLITYGCIITNQKDTTAERIVDMTKQLDLIIKKFRPNVLAIEQIFFNLNKKTAIPVAQAQGAIMLLAAWRKMDIVFLTPLQVKLTLTGYGHADKKQVEKILKISLGLHEIPQPDDIADAMACALSYCYIYRNINKVYDRQN